MIEPRDRFRRVLFQLQEFWRWLLKSENLPPSEPDRRSSPQTLQALGWLLVRERLQPAEETDRVEERSFLGWLVVPEARLHSPPMSGPAEETNRVEEGSFLGWLVVPEARLQKLPESEPAEQKTLRWLLAAEHLPQPPRLKPEKSFLGHLFARESLPRLQANESTNGGGST